MALNDKQKAFVKEYVKNGGNSRAAAIAAGYAESTAEEANKWVKPPKTLKGKNLYRPYLVEAIDAERERALNEAQKQAEKEGRWIAAPEDIIAFHSGVLSGEEKEKQVVMVGTGNGYTRPETIERPPTLKEKQMSANALARIYGMEKANVNIDAAIPVVISGSDKLAD